MNLVEDYIKRSKELIGDRTKSEIQYDNEVIRWLQKGKSIKKAITKANEKCPDEALDVSIDNLGDVAAHYEYLKNHEDIVNKMPK